MEGGAVSDDWLHNEHAIFFCLSSINNYLSFHEFIAFAINTSLKSIVGMASYSLLQQHENCILSMK